MKPQVGTSVVYYPESHYYGLAAIVTHSPPGDETLTLRVFAPHGEEDYAAFGVTREMSDVKVRDLEEQHSLSRGMWRNIGEDFPVPSQGTMGFVFMGGQTFPDLDGSGKSSWITKPKD